MIEMLMESATDVRKEWSSVLDSVVREKPKFIKRTRDRMWLSNLTIMEDILQAYSFSAERFIEPDGSVTLSLNEMDLIENGENEETARLELGKSILEYAEEYYNDFSYWSSAPNRKSHIPYVFKAIIADDAKKIGDSIICQDGKN